MAVRRDAASAFANRSGCTSPWRARRRLSRSARSSRNRRGSPNSSKSSAARFIQKRRARAAGPLEVSEASSHPERFAAAAPVLLARIVELEAFVQAFTHEVELRAVDVGQALGIDDDLDAVILEDVILGRKFVGVLELVGEAG